MLGPSTDVQAIAATPLLGDAGGMFWLAFEQVGIGMALVGLDGRILRANPELCRFLGYTPDLLKGRSLRDITHPSGINESIALYRRVLAGEKGAPRMEERFVRRDGSAAWGRTGVSLVRDEAGKPLHFLVMVADIDLPRQAQEDLARIHVRYAAIIDNVDDFVFAIDFQGTFTYASQSAVRLLGFTPDELIGTSIYDLVHPEDQEAVFERLAGFFEGSDERIALGFRFLHKDGRWVAVETWVAAITDDTGGAHEIAGAARESQGTLPDTPMQRQTASTMPSHSPVEQKPEATATDDTKGKDPLTGVRSKPAIEDLAVARLASQRAANFPIGCLVVDVDLFKQVNDTHGRPAGDEVLRRISKVLQSSCRDDDFIGRCDDDRFLLVLPNTNPAGTIILGEKLIRNVRAIDWAGTPIEDRVTISIGATCVQHGSGLTLPDLMGILEMQLRQAKEAGRNRMVMNTRQITGKIQY